MNVYSIPESYPIGTKMILVDDDPGTIHEVYGYEWFGDHANIIFLDGTKLSMDRLELIVEVMK